MEQTFITKKRLKDGREYSIRKDRRRYFFPDEWEKFFSALKEGNKPLFDFLINTGCRINEARIRSMDFDFGRNTVRIWNVKKNTKIRTINISNAYSQRVKQKCSNLKPEEFLFEYTNQGVNQLLKNKLKKIGIKDWFNFSTNNLHETYMKWRSVLADSKDFNENINIIKKFFGDLNESSHNS